MEGMRRYLLRQLPQSDLLYLTPYNTVSRTAEYTMDHLVGIIFILYPM